MNKLLIILLIVYQVDCFAQSAWQSAIVKPAGSIAIQKLKHTGKSENQISCEHLRFRYKELENIIGDISWINALKTSEAKNEAHQYIQNRLQADPRKIASSNIFEIQFLLTESILKNTEKPLDAILVLGADNLDLFLPNTVDGNMEITRMINTYDICAKKSIDVLFLRDCQKDTAVSLPYEWQACGDVIAYKVNLKSLEKKVGLRKREIKRDTP